MQISRHTLYHLCLITLLGFSLLGGIIIVLLQNRPFYSIFMHGIEWPLQLLYGAGGGTIAALLALALIYMPFMKPVRQFFTELFGELELKWRDAFFFSFCAGVGEEILFRAAIQHWLGIWLTSLLFVALHGYLSPRNWRLSIYGFFMIFVSSGLGYLYEYAGLLSAITAHFTIDLILFAMFIVSKKKRALPEQGPPEKSQD